MTTYTFPDITPNDLVISYDHNAATHLSALSGAIHAIGRGGEFITMQLSFRNLRGASRAEMVGFIAKLNGPQHRFTLQNYAEDQQGVFGGSPIVKGASQLGTMLAIDGCSNDITDWMKAGDWFGVGGELKIATLDADTNGSGETTLTFRPRLHSAPADDSAVTISDATGVFMLISDSVSWSNRPGRNGPWSDVTFLAVEDVTA